MEDILKLHERVAVAEAKVAEAGADLAAAKAKYNKYDKLLESEGLTPELVAEYKENREEAKDLQKLAIEEHKVAVEDRNALLKHLEEAKARLPALKVLQKASFNEGLSEFFVKEYELKRQRLDSRTKAQDAAFNFGESLFGESTTPSIAYVRECYLHQADLIHDLFGTKNDKPIHDCKSVFIGGARGVGKSILGVIMTFEFVDLGFVVLYEHKDARLLLIPKNVRDEQKEVLRLACKTKGYRELLEPGVYQFESADDMVLFDALVTRKEPIHVQDYGDGGHGGLRLDGLTRRLMLSSPRDDRLEKMHKTVPRTKTVFMPLWTLEELLSASRISFPHLDEATIRERFRMYGGIARHVLEHTDADSRRLFRQQLNLLTMDKIQEIMSAGTYENLPSFRSLGYLIHVKPNRDPSEFLCAFASTYAFEKIMEAFLRHQKFKARQFADIIKSHPDFASLYGKCLESTAHYYLAMSEETQTYPVHPLAEGTRKPKDVKNIVWPLITATKRFNSIKDLAVVTVNEYYCPYSKIYETIDSFVLMDGSTLDSTRFKKDQIVLVLIQVTVSERHRVNGAKIKEVHGDVYERWNGKTELAPSDTALNKLLPRVLVFATRKAPKGVHSYQTPTTADHKQYVEGNAPALPEYALVLEKDFEELWGSMEESIRKLPTA